MRWYLCVMLWLWGSVVAVYICCLLVNGINFVVKPLKWIHENRYPAAVPWFTLKSPGCLCNVVCCVISAIAAPFWEGVSGKPHFPACLLVSAALQSGRYLSSAAVHIAVPEHTLQVSNNCPEVCVHLIQLLLKFDKIFFLFNIQSENICAVWFLTLSAWGDLQPALGCWR